MSKHKLKALREILDRIVRERRSGQVTVCASGKLLPEEIFKADGTIDMYAVSRRYVGFRQAKEVAHE